MSVCSEGPWSNDVCDHTGKWAGPVLRPWVDLLLIRRRRLVGYWFDDLKWPIDWFCLWRLVWTCNFIYVWRVVILCSFVSVYVLCVVLDRDVRRERRNGGERIEIKNGGRRGIRRWMSPLSDPAWPKHFNPCPLCFYDVRGWQGCVTTRGGIVRRCQSFQLRFREVQRGQECLRATSPQKNKDSLGEVERESTVYLPPK